MRPGRAFSDEPVERLLAMSGHLDDSTRRALYRGQLAGVTRRASGGQSRPASTASRAIRWTTTLLIDGQLALVDDMLHYFDRASMAHSLEVRVPFLDHHLVEYCATIPHDLKVRRADRKYLLKRVARGILPDSVNRQAKAGLLQRGDRRLVPGPGGGRECARVSRVHPTQSTPSFLTGTPFARWPNVDASGSSSDGRLLLAVARFWRSWLAATYLVGGDRRRRRRAGASDPGV